MTPRFAANLVLCGLLAIVAISGCGGSTSTNTNTVLTANARWVPLTPSFADADPSDPLDACFGAGRRSGSTASLTIRGRTYRDGFVQCGIEDAGYASASGSLRFFPPIRAGSVVTGVRGRFAVDEGSYRADSARVSWTLRQGGKTICRARVTGTRPAQCSPSAPGVELTDEPIVLEQRVAAGSQSVWAGVQGLALKATPGDGRLISTAPRPGTSDLAAWSQAQAELASATVLRPKATLGLRLEGIKTEVVPCGDQSASQLVATYAGTGGRKLTIYEGTPYFCGDMGDGGETESRAMIRGVNGYVYDGGAGGRLWVSWKDAEGPTIQVVAGDSGQGSSGVSRSDLMRVAYSMTTVPPARGIAPLDEERPPAGDTYTDTNTAPSSDSQGGSGTSLDWESFSEATASSIFHSDLSGQARMRAMARDMALILNGRSFATDRCMRTDTCSTADVQAQIGVARGFAQALRSISDSDRQSGAFCYSAVAQLAGLAEAFAALATAGPVVWRLDLPSLQRDLVTIANDAGSSCG